MNYLTTFELYSLVSLVAIFSYVLGIVIRGVAAEKSEDEFRKRIIGIHSAALIEVNHLRKDIRNEMEVRKTAEKLAAQRLREIEALQAHMPKPFTGGEASLSESISNGELEKDDRAA